MKKIFLLIAVLFLALPVFADDDMFTGTTIGPDVSVLDGKKLQWEAGSFDYFVMFKSLMSNTVRDKCDVGAPVGCDYDDNPEPDTCLASSTFHLTSQHVPEDAYIEAAYLVWTVSVDPNNVHTDNKATLSFVSDDGQINETVTVTAPRVGMLGTKSDPGQQDFTFEGIAWEENNGNIYGGHYTYRVDVTDFFTMIHNDGRDLGYASDGLSLYGNYTVGDIDCTNNQQYLSQVYLGSDYQYHGLSAGVLGGWSLITVYRSTKVKAKMVYIYNGFSMYKFETVDVGVSGFEFPDKPLIKMTLAVNEGDPGIAVASDTECENNICPPEGLRAKGQTTPEDSEVFLFNNCNPAQNKSGFSYTEVYNSISSFYGWNDATETCIGGNPNAPDPDTLEYTMDVDTFLLDAETNTFFDEQFKKGDTSMTIKVGANGDLIYTNYLVVSLDTKAPKFDIPVNPATPDGREKNYCSCSEQADAVCPTAPFYFMIKVQNWGDDISENVTVQDTLPTKINYVSGTTEICRDWKSDNVCKKWEKVEDVNGSFPLANPYKVADRLERCDLNTQVCPETIMIRFRVQPKENLAKNEVIENTAIINDNNNRPYKSNTSIPLRLTFGNCPSAALCENPDLTKCGGYGDGEGCSKNEDCDAGQTCQNGSCVTDSSLFAKSAHVNIVAGKNTPISDDAAIIIASPAEKLVAGQFSLIASSEENKKNFTFESVIASLNIKDANTIFSNLQLVYDANGNGLFDDGEAVVAEAQSVNSKTATFALKSAKANYPTNELHHFIIVTDVKYESASGDIPIDTTFNFKIEDVSSFKFGNVANITSEMSPAVLEFAKFSFEPTVEAFVFTKGSVEPPVPSPSKINSSSVGVLQIRAKSIKKDDKIKKITLKATSKSVKFKEGITKIELYLDENKDALAAGEKKIASVEPKDVSSILEIVFDEPLSFAADEEKTLLLVAKFNIPKEQMAQIEIQKSKVKLASGNDPIGLPVKSKEFSYKCEAGDLTCQDDGDSGGCAVTEIAEPDSAVLIVSSVFALLFGFAAVIRRFVWK